MTGHLMTVLQSMAVEFIHSIQQYIKKTIFAHQLYNSLTPAYQMLIRKEIRVQLERQHGKQEH